MHVRRMILLLASASLTAVPLAMAAQTGGGAPPAAGQLPAAASGHPTGVIHPPRHVDPGINQTPPPSVAHGTDPMPVIRPPGAPGANGTVVPK